LEKAIPIHNDLLWNKLSFTKNLEKDSNRWTFNVFSSLKLWNREDCLYIEKLLIEQSKNKDIIPFTDEDKKNYQFIK